MLCTAVQSLLPVPGAGNGVKHRAGDPLGASFHAIFSKHFKLLFGRGTQQKQPLSPYPFASGSGSGREMQAEAKCKKAEGTQPLLTSSKFLACQTLAEAGGVGRNGAGIQGIHQPPQEIGAGFRLRQKKDLRLCRDALCIASGFMPKPCPIQLSMF